MMYAFGIGEVAVSVSGDPTGTDSAITYTIRSVGAVRRALHDAQPGSVIGTRGPFGTNWRLADGPVVGYDSAEPVLAVKEL